MTLRVTQSSTRLTGCATTRAHHHRLISPDEMKAVLHAMNNTVSYFGDDKLGDDHVESMVKEVRTTA